MASRQDLLTAKFEYGVEYRDEHDVWWPLQLDSSGTTSVPREQTARNLAERHTIRTLQDTRVILIEVYVSIV